MARTNYIWDEVNDTLLAETDEAGNTIAEYTHEPGRFGPLIFQRRNGQTRYHHYDGLGNTVALTDESGQVTDTYTHTAFGEPVASLGTSTNPFGYKGALGYYANPETNDLDVRRRTYQPVVARWSSQDPLLYPLANSDWTPDKRLATAWAVMWNEGAHGLIKIARLLGWDRDASPGDAYAYVSNSPNRWVDPLGEQRVLADTGAYPSQDVLPDPATAQRARDLQGSVLKKLCSCCESRRLVKDLNNKEVFFCERILFHWLEPHPQGPKHRQRPISGRASGNTLYVNMSLASDELWATIVHEYEHTMQEDGGEVGAFAAETRMALACGWRTKHVGEFTKRVFVPRRCRLGWCRRGHWVTVVDEEAIKRYVDASEIYEIIRSGKSFWITHKDCVPLRDWKCDR